MSENITAQVQFFLLCIGTGAGINVFYDILRISRRIHRRRFMRIGIEDLIYWSMTALLVFFIICVKNNGEIRAYGIAGIGIGIFSFRTWISPITVRFFTRVFSKVDKFLKKALNMLKKGLKKLAKTVKIRLCKL